MKIYSNEKNIQLISSMISKDREPHSLIICGEKGQGKKTLAKYISAQLLCECGGEKPCGKCKSCLMIEKNEHPDFITILSNDNGNYQVDTIRSIVSDAVIKPNEGDFKVYLIPDLDRSNSTATQVQNILLKLIEEPPPHCIVILTAVSKQIFLPTIISRVLCLNAEPCTKEQSAEWLGNFNKYSDEDIRSAIMCGHGNFGRCLEFLEGDLLPAAFEIAKQATDAMINRDEYLLLKAFFAADGKKQIFRQALVFLSEIARDSCTIFLGLDCYSGCYFEGAKKLSAVLSQNISQMLYELFTNYILKIDANSNLTLTINALTGEISDLIFRRD